MEEPQAPEGQVDQNPVPEQPAPEPQAPEAPSAAAETSPPASQKTPMDIFVERYQQLSEELGLTFSVEPKFMRRDDGTYSIVVETTVTPR